MKYTTMENAFFKPIKESVKHWYLPVISGIILILISLWTFRNPAESYLGLSILFSISFLLAGTIEVIFSIVNRKQIDNWGWSLVLGSMTTLIGVLLLLNPEVSKISLPLYIGFLLLFRSFYAIGLAIDMKSYGELEWGTLLVIGVLGSLFSFILIWNPILGGISIVIWTGIALLTGGIFNIFLGFKMKKAHKNWDKVSDELKSQFTELEEQIKNEIAK